jgi:tetratricopeptide (TPR) repeat protein
MKEGSQQRHLARALGLARAGQVLQRRRDLNGALEQYRAAAALLEEEEPTPLLANVLRWEGTCLRDKGDNEAADARYAESFDVARQSGSLEGQAAAINCRAVIAQRRGDLENALRLYTSAVQHAAAAGDLRLSAMIQMNLGVLNNIKGDLNAARYHYQQALRAFEELGADESACWTLNNLGMLFNDLGLPSAAEKRLNRGLTIARMRGDRHAEGILLTNLSEGLIAMNRWEEARATLDEAFDITFENGEPERIAEVLKFYGVLQRDSGHPEKAHERLREALNVAARVGNRLLVAEVLRERGELHRREGALDAARRDWNDALGGFRAAGADRDVAELQTRIDDLDSTGEHAESENG